MSVLDEVLAAIKSIEGLPPAPKSIEMSELTLAWLKNRYASTYDHQYGALPGLLGVPVVENDELPFGKIEVNK